jgi:hypothetical protein
VELAITLRMMAEAVIEIACAILRAGAETFVARVFD